MNDLEICKRIAEIEGIKVYVNNEGIKVYVNNIGVVLTHCVPSHPSDRHNPLTDDALCFQLMIKYRMEVFPVGKTFWCAWDGINLNSRKNSAHLNKAICLSIIEIYKENK